MAYELNIPTADGKLLVRTREGLISLTSFVDEESQGS
jgi:hypothetical protein